MWGCVTGLGDAEGWREGGSGSFLVDRLRMRKPDTEYGQPGRGVRRPSHGGLSPALTFPQGRVQSHVGPTSLGGTLTVLLALSLLGLEGA